MSIDRRAQQRGAPISRNSGELHRILVESVSDYAIFALDADGHVLSWNPGAERFKGYGADEIIGRHFSVFYPEEDVAAGKPATALEAASRDGRFEAEGWRVRKDGTRFWANVVITALRDEAGMLVGFAKVTRDLTERRRVEEQARQLAAEEAAHAEAKRRGEELAQLNEQLQNQAIELEAQTEEAQVLLEELEQTNDVLHRALEEAEQARAAAERAARSAAAAARDAADANRAKSNFLAMMSHELRTPLNAIAGYAELLEIGVHGPVTDAQREALSRIQRSQRHLLSLINDVLNFAKLEAGHVTVSLAPVPVAELLSGVDGLVAPQIRAKRLAYTNLGASDDLRASADRDKVAQILLNLLSNAIKFTDVGGEVEIGAGARDGMIAIWVRDTGIGIPADRIQVAFEPFVQVGRELSVGQGGTGLGLSISRDLAHMMNGEITVESTPGVGSTFTLSLPAA